MSTADRPNRKRGSTVFVGIVADAKVLGVSYRWLWCVITGRAKQDKLLARYRALKEAQRLKTEFEQAFPTPPGRTLEALSPVPSSKS